MRYIGTSLMQQLQEILKTYLIINVTAIIEKWKHLEINIGDEISNDVWQVTYKGKEEVIHSAIMCNDNYNNNWNKGTNIHCSVQ